MQIKPEKTEARTQQELAAADVAAQEETERLPYSRREIIFTMIGVLSVVFLSILDQTIVGVAMPRIVADFRSFDLIVWVSTAYLLTSTVPIPIYGKLSDLFGRKPIMLFGIVVFLAGSALCGTAQTMNQLIVFRDSVCLAATELQPIAIAIIGDLF